MTRSPSVPYPLKSNALKLSIASTLSLSFLLVGNAYGQSDTPQKVSRIEEVVVTARRKEESSQNVPLAITALDASALENFRIQNLDDLQRFDPSFTVSSASGRPNAPVYSLRGIRPTETIYGQDPTVAVYMADVVLSPAKGSNLGMYDLQSVQVLKGPQGTLFGRNTTGGAILLTPTKPGDTLAGNVMMGMGNFGLYESEFGLDIPLTEELAIRVAGKAENSEGYQTNVAPGPFYGDKRGGGKSRSGRVTAVWTPTDTIENTTILTYDDINLNGRSHTLQAVRPDSAMRFYNGGAPFNLPSIFDALERAQNRSVHKIESDMNETSEVSAQGIINTTTVELGNEMVLKSILGYRDMEGYEVVDLDATAIEGVLTSVQTTELEHASYELQLQGDSLDNDLSWVTGLYWYYEKGFQNNPGDVLAGISADNPALSRADMENTSYSLFGQGTYSLSDSLSVTAGLRWNYDNKQHRVASGTPSACGLTDPQGNTLPRSRCYVNLETSFEKPTGSVSLEYRPNDQIMMYAASRLGYRAGGFNSRATQTIAYEPFDPEEVVDFELGAKSDWFVGDWSMRTNIALYQQWYDDIQRTVNTLNQFGVPSSVVENAASATIFGAELEQIISPTENLTLKFQYAYTDPEYKDWSDPATGNDLSSTPFFFTPENAFTFSFDYTYPLADGGLIRLGGNASYQDDVWIAALQTSATIDTTPAAVQPSLRQDEYWLFGVNLGWEQVMGSNLDLSAYVKNLTDEEYTVGGLQLYHSLGLSTKVFGQPRTYGLQARYRF